MGSCNSCMVEATPAAPAQPQIVEIQFHHPPPRRAASRSAVTTPRGTPLTVDAGGAGTSSGAAATAATTEALGFAIATGISHESSAERAVKDAFGQVIATLGDARRLSLLVVMLTNDHNSGEVAAALASLAPGVPMIGGTQSTGLFTETGWHSRDTNDCTLGIFAIRDPEGYYAVGHAQLNTRGETGIAGEVAKSRCRQAGATALLSVILDTPVHVGRHPNGIWVISEMDSEEGVLQGVSDVLRASAIRPCAIGGGSSGNSDGSHAGRQIANGKAYLNSVVLAVMHSSANISGTFGNGFKPAEPPRSGIITKASGRWLHEIDGRPAADVYNEWNEQLLKEAKPGQVLLHDVALTPLGRVKLHGENGVPQHVLSTTLEVTTERGLHVLTEVEVGERVYQMRSTPEGVVKNLTEMARKMVRQSKGDAHGYLVAFCSCYVLRFREQFSQIGNDVSRVFGKPWLGSNTFGEQGTFSGIEGLYAHGNLMVSAFVFCGHRNITEDIVLSQPAPPVGEIALLLLDMPAFGAIKAKDATASEQARAIINQFIESRLSAVRGYISPLQQGQAATPGDNTLRILIAMPTALDALTLILTLQTLLVNLAWPDALLAMPECRELRSPKGTILFRGPRFRLTAHFGHPDFNFVPGIDGAAGSVHYSGKAVDDLLRLHDCLGQGTSVVTQELLDEATKSVTHYFQRKTTLEKAVKNISFLRPPRSTKQFPEGMVPVGVLSKHLSERVDVDM